MIDERRMATLERRLERVEEAVGLAMTEAPERPRRAEAPPAAPVPERVRATDLEAWTLPAGPAPSPWQASSPPPPEPEAAAATERATLPDLEELLGGRLLAFAGGAALLVGFAFFLAIAISHGWLGETARCVIAAAGAFGLIGAGVRLKAPVAALTAIGAGIAALDVDVTVAAQTYNLIGTPLALMLVLSIGAAATAFALKRSSEVLASFGIVGGLLAPALAGADYDGATVALLLAATVPAAAVLIAKRWDRIAVAAFAVTAVQVGLWLADGAPAAGPALLALGAFGVLWVVQAVGFELRIASGTLRPVSAGLLAANALFLAGAGAAVLTARHQTVALDVWLAGLAVAHLVVGVAAHRLRRVSAELGVLALTLGVVLADVALATTLNGVALPIAYAAGALLFAAISRLRPARVAEQALVGAGLGGHVLLAACTALAAEGTADIAVALGSVAAASFAAARVGTLPRPFRGALDGVALAALAWIAARTLTPIPLVLAWAAEAVALAQVWRRSRDGVAAGAAWMHLLGATGVAVAVVAPPLALADGLPDALGAAAVLIAVALAWWRIGRVELTTEDLGLPNIINYATSALLLLYLASTEIVTPLPFHTGQVALSALWALTGIATLVIGLTTNHVALRRAGLLLLMIALAKVLLFDLETLTSAARAGSFLALGTILLTAAAAWHRYTPRELPSH
ncbi:DUF2339 domain-containing protein [Conexibacter woesei]|uniref:DUF2339 domain-containing protein n=1 Tax=Conexibacter woesei TaxID=191495 RepID=UPI0004207A4D|nr:DUF2339 domain-containing protein [Conexibacter woesei]